MGNSEWEYKNQETLKAWYQEKISGKKPNLAVRKIICKGCGREFYTQIKSKKYCLYHLCGNRGYRKELSERAREARKDRVCRPAARCLRLQDRTVFIAPTLADRKHTAKMLRITK